MLYMLYMNKIRRVQNWKATHLPTLDIRVEQKGSLVMKAVLHGPPENPQTSKSSKS